MILTQMDAVTNDYFKIDGGKALDIYFQTSFLLDYLLKQKKGLMIRPSGGLNIRIPIRYDGNTSGWYERGATISSDKREAITAVSLQWKHAYGSSTMYRVDELKNSGPEAQIKLINEELYGMQEQLRLDLANAIYNEASTPTSKEMDGLGAPTDTDATTAYAGYSSNDIVSADGTKVWTGLGDDTAQPISLALIRDAKSIADHGTGKMDEPDFMATSKVLYNHIREVLTVQQRFTKEGSEPVKAGFTGVHFEGTDLFPDRYCPDGNAYLLNSQHIGFAVHKQGMFQRTPWRMIQGSAEDKTIKNYFDGNLICDNRRALYRFQNLTA